MREAATKEPVREQEEIAAGIMEYARLHLLHTVEKAAIIHETVFVHEARSGREQVRIELGGDPWPCHSDGFHLEKARSVKICRSDPDNQLIAKRGRTLPM